MFKTFTAAVLAVSFAGAAMAEEKKSDFFISATPEAQESFINSSLLMAQALLPKSQGDCIGQWATKQRADHYVKLIATIKEHETYHPSTVIAAVIEKACNLQLAKN